FDSRPLSWSNPRTPYPRLEGCMTIAKNSECASFLALLMACLTGATTSAAPAVVEEKTGRPAIDGTVFSDLDDRQRLAEMWAKDVRQRRIAANDRETDAWRLVRSRKEWEEFRDVRREALRQSLGKLHDAPPDLKIAVTGTVRGKDYQIENLV